MLKCGREERVLYGCPLSNIGKAVVKHRVSRSPAVMNPRVCLRRFRCQPFINQIYCYICSAHANEVSPNAETRH